MHDTLITDHKQASATWLTEVLRATGDLETGRVVDVHMAGATSTHAAHSRLLLSDAPGATGAKPGSLFLKICNAESAACVGRTEIDLYAKIGAPIVPDPAPRCYQYGYDESGRYCLLLEDLSETHHTNVRTEPTAESAHKTAQALAALHRYWWDHPDLRTDERYPTAEVVARHPLAHRSHRRPSCNMEPS